MNQIWFKNAILYSLDVERFYDENGDGIGDFQGLTTKLDYLSALGINCLWLLPFYPSPNRDNGYDVTDYYNIDPRLGTLGDFSKFMDKADQLGIRVIIDLVVNHTSVEHPWFLEAAKNPESDYRDYYVWSEKPLEYEQEKLMLSGEVNTVWTYSHEAGMYYLHRFYREQPDLNIGNSAVRLEILRIMGFWLRLGVSGFRVDAAEILIEPYGMKDTGEYDLTCFLEEMRDFISMRRSDAILIAETNVLPDKMNTYLDHGKKMHMVFNFFLNQHLFLAMAKGESSSLSNALGSLSNLSDHNQWLNFLRHHDELSLRLLTEDERQIIYKKFAPDHEMRIYGHGVRRRIAPMLQGNRAFLELAYSLLFSMPGIAMVRYGEEIGMGENLQLPGRSSVRTPMQWTDEEKGGFSVSEKNHTHPVISGGEYGFEQVNVLKQQRDPGSFLSWITRLIITRKQFPEIGMGEKELVETSIPNLLIHILDHKGRKTIFFHNLSGEPATITINDTSLRGLNLYEMFGDDKSGSIDPGSVTIAPYGYKWCKEKR